MFPESLRCFVTCKQNPCCCTLCNRYNAQYRELVSGEVKSITARFVLVTTGILGDQQTFQDRGYTGIETFKGVTTLAGRQNGVDSLIGRMDCSGKVGPASVCPGYFSLSHGCSLRKCCLHPISRLAFTWNRRFASLALEHLHVKQWK